MTQTTFTCAAGVRNINGLSVFWIRSPRTGKTLEIAVSGWLDQIPVRVRGRIAQAAATGRHASDFTRDELVAFADVHARMMKACTPVHTENYGHKFNRSWSRGW